MPALVVPDAQAKDISALERRFSWVRHTALGVPVVPPVYSRAAASETLGSGKPVAKGMAEAARSSQERTPAGILPRSSRRWVRAAATGSLRARRLRSGR